MHNTATEPRTAVRDVCGEKIWGKGLRLAWDPVGVAWNRCLGELWVAVQEGDSAVGRLLSVRWLSRAGLGAHIAEKMRLWYFKVRLLGGR
jgi:hypothetical protein